jgi:hypothetical protein
MNARREQRTSCDITGEYIRTKTVKPNIAESKVKKKAGTNSWLHPHRFRKNNSHQVVYLLQADMRQMTGHKPQPAPQASIELLLGPKVPDPIQP